MNNLESKGEKQLRERLRNHEFAADESAWEQLEGWLDAHRPLPETTPPQAGAWTVRRRWLLGLLCVLLAGWWLIAAQQTEDTDHIAITASEQPETGRQPEPAASNRTASAASREQARTADVSGKIESTATALPPGERMPAAADRTASAAFRNASKTATVPGKPAPAARRSPDFRSAEKKSGLLDGQRQPEEKTLASGGAPEEVSALAPAAGSTLPSAPVAPVVAAGMEVALLPVPERKAALTSLPRFDLPLGKRRQAGGTTVPWPAPRAGHNFQLGLAGGVQWAYTKRELTFQNNIMAPTFGISARYATGGRWSLQADLLYRSVNYELVATFQDSRLNPAGFLEYWSYSAWANDLEFYELPLVVKRSCFHGRARFFGGLRPAFVQPAHTGGGGGAIGAFAPAVEAFAPSIRQGIRRFDLAVVLGVEFRISRNIWLDLRANQGLLDLTHDDFFQNTRTDLTTDAQVGLRYYLFSL